MRNSDSCWVCDREALIMCAKCQFAGYCTKKCQKAHWPKHKSKCKKYYERPGGVARLVADQRSQPDLLQRMVGMSIDITNLIVAATRKHLWRPEYMSGGAFTHFFSIEYTYKVRHVALPSTQRLSLAELKTCPKSRIPFILNMCLNEYEQGEAPEDFTLEIPLIPVRFINMDNGKSFEYIPLVLSARDADEIVAYFGADKVDLFPFVSLFNGLIAQTEWLREPEFRDICESAETDSDE